MPQLDDIEFLALEQMFKPEGIKENPVLRIYAPNRETGMHQIIFQDMLRNWKIDVTEEGWSMELEASQDSFKLSDENIGELKVRLKPSTQIWLRTPDSAWVVEIFRWSEFEKSRGFHAIITDAWREQNPATNLPN